MAALAKQVSIGGLDSKSEEDESIKASKGWRKELWLALWYFAEGYVCAETGLKKYDGCAYHLNKRWEDEGRPVTGGALKNAIKDENRNNFRLEWAFWFAEQSAEIAELLARKVKPKKTAEQRLADTDDEIRATLSHKQAEAFFRRRDGR